ncbi:unnamed protein product [Didymodactylos carnosus]|uniref:Uncharacterized protein n=1 Tax=Didymodactylos carnosus TaxID=1234261 RepID=A0A815IHV0_9BILA|nr:unnamed protein product [Didymodactylos carnosus]CAF1368541.1 unnamed protein product [Didymodactylos carnosus]CAF4067185.1 unnamed protein product [Didymodactylos carnosus]CAF4252942.1 unnamed protein product [Didymodactylos carnosus]
MDEHFSGIALKTLPKNYKEMDFEELKQAICTEFLPGKKELEKLLKEAVLPAVNAEEQRRCEDLLERRDELNREVVIQAVARYRNKLKSNEQMYRESVTGYIHDDLLQYFEHAIYNRYQNEPAHKPHGRFHDAVEAAKEIEAASFINNGARVCDRLKARFPIPTLVEHGPDDLFTQHQASRAFVERARGDFTYKEWPSLY